MDALRVIVNNLYKQSFYVKKKKINILTVLSISYQSGIEIFLKWIVNHYPKTLVNMTHYI